MNTGVPTMRAVIANRYGAPSTFQISSVAVPAPGEGQIRIRVAACGISFVDGLISQGEYQIKPVPPFSPGSEFSGVVDALGPGVSTANVGDRVCASAVYGGFAEHVCVRAEAAHKIPDDMDFDTAAVFGVSYATSYYALVQRGQLRYGETLFVLGAGGAVGHAAVQIGRMLGARVIAAASTAAKREHALSAGAASAIDMSLADWRPLLKQAAGPTGINVILDPVGGRSSEPAFRSLAWNGRYLVVGFAAGTIAALPLNLPLLKGAAVVGVDIRQFNEREPQSAGANLVSLFEGYRCAQLRPAIAQLVPMEDFAEGMRLATSGALTGRVVLRMY